MQTIIQCTKTRLGAHAFYIKHDGTNYLLFVQKYHKGVDEVFNNGVDLDKALSPKIAKRDPQVLKTISKMRLYIKYIEKEYQVKILDSSINKGIINRRKLFKDKYRECYSW
jgi:hypothetical protein